MATSKITDGPGWSVRSTVRSKRSSITNISDSRRSKRRVLTTPEMTTAKPSMLRTRAMGMKIRWRANSSTTRPFDSWWPAGGAALHHNIADLSHLVPGAVEDWQAPDA